jgi:hypothetical protein
MAAALPMPVPAPVTIAVLPFIAILPGDAGGIADAPVYGKHTKRAAIGDRPLI